MMWMAFGAVAPLIMRIVNIAELVGGKGAIWSAEVNSKSWLYAELVRGFWPPVFLSDPRDEQGVIPLIFPRCVTHLLPLISQRYRRDGTRCKRYRSGSRSSFPLPFPSFPQPVWCGFISSFPQFSATSMVWIYVIMILVGTRIFSDIDIFLPVFRHQHGVDLCY